MKLQILDDQGRPREISARRVLVLADDGVTPLGVALEYQRGVVYVGHAGEASFANVLAVLGVDKTVAVERFSPKGFDEIVHRPM